MNTRKQQLSKEKKNGLKNVDAQFMSFALIEFPSHSARLELNRARVAEGISYV